MENNIFEHLSQTLKDRKENPKEGSYSSELFRGGDNRIVKKLGEETAEFIKAFLTESGDSVASEAADLIYHIMVALEYRDVPIMDVLDVLNERRR